jgi:hypothetical protein
MYTLFAHHDAVILDIVKAIAASGIYEMADFKLNVASTIFHDLETYDFFMITNDKEVVVGDTVKGVYNDKDLAGEAYYQKAIVPRRCRRFGKDRDPLRGDRRRAD